MSTHQISSSAAAQAFTLNTAESSPIYQNHALKYRPDIDGMRAIAVIAVIIFHAFPKLLSGGFVGVDIFFVISGYLISHHIISEINDNSFSLKTFYIRRIKRIFPALIVVITTTMIIGWIMLTPSEYRMLGRPIAGGAGFVANFVFWKEAGYFDSAAITKPLLHLWSLGIEEQFYIVWPFLLMFFCRHYSRQLFNILSSVLILSLAYSTWLVYFDDVAAFYNPLSRLWELALGGLFAYMTLQKQTIIQTKYQNPFSIMAISLIVISIVSFRENYYFPGLLALLPTVGAAILINCPNSWLNKYCLSHPILVAIGLISYPLYLWHWPLLSFYSIFNGQTASGLTAIALIVSSFILAFATYLLIERPIRFSAKNRTTMWIKLMVTCMIVLLICGVSIRKMKGFGFRVTHKLNGDITTLALGANTGQLKPQCGIDNNDVDLFQYCSSDDFENANYAIIGDSKAHALFFGLARESDSSLNGVLYGSVGAPAVTPAQIEAAKQSRDNTKQDKKNLIVFDNVLHNPKLKTVVLTIAMRALFQTDEETGFIQGKSDNEYSDNLIKLSHMIRKYQQANKQVIFVVDNPTLPDPRSCIGGGMTQSDLLNHVFKRSMNPRCAIQYTDFLNGTKQYRELIDTLAQENPGLIVYDTANVVCDINNNQCSIMKDGNYLYSYGDHISDYANSAIAKELLPVIEKGIQERA